MTPHDKAGTATRRPTGPSLPPDNDPLGQVAHLLALTHELLLSAEYTQDQAEQTAEDIRQRARGNTRVSCRWCDGEFYMPSHQAGPYECRQRGWICPALGPTGDM